MIDVTQQINAVRRQVGTRVLEAGEARTVTISQSYDAAVEDVWDACTNPERIPRWFLPITGDLRAGGRYQLQGNAGGTIERCDPPTSFAATWEFGGQVSWIEVWLVAEPGGGTRLVLEHIAQMDDERWAEFGPGAVGVGWDMGLVGLSIHLSSGRWVRARPGPRRPTAGSSCRWPASGGATRASRRAPTRPERGRPPTGPSPPTPAPVAKGRPGSTRRAAPARGGQLWNRWVIVRILSPV
jgi:uncharacterized protein YndB with AHSA1/START domain